MSTTGNRTGIRTCDLCHRTRLRGVRLCGMHHKLLTLGEPPETVVTAGGASLQACRFFDLMEAVLNVKVTHLHVPLAPHVDPYVGYEATVTGQAEDGSLKTHRVDGLVRKPTGHLCVVEFQGEYWHRDRGEQDADKLNSLVRQGWTVYVVTPTASQTTLGALLEAHGGKLVRCLQRWNSIP